MTSLVGSGGRRITMLETVDLDARTSKSAWREKKDGLVSRLVRLQQECLRAKVGVVVCVDGWSAAGKGTTISKLVKDLDPRTMRVWAMSEPDATESRHHFLTRYWERVGSWGTLTIFDGSWYAEGITGGWTSRERIESAMTMERQLADDGYAVVKCFFHVSEGEQARRLDELERRPETVWRVTAGDRAQNADYARWASLYEELLAGTDSERCPWHVIAADDPRTRRLAFMETLAEAMEEALAGAGGSGGDAGAGSEGDAGDAGSKEVAGTSGTGVGKYALIDMPRVEDLRHDLRIDDDDYRRELKREQKRLSKLQFELYLRRIPSMLVFEGWDAAGKGGAIKRITAALDARDYRVVPSSAPTKPEKEHPFLWRYWTNLPKSGHMRIYDRSWYGRVMVERIEGFASEAEWRRAYGEICDFEREMVSGGALLMKFWIDVSPDEQLARFEARRDDPEKAWKLTDEDWRNREKYDEYCEAINDMFERTSTDFAPWILVESDDKHYARVKVLRELNDAIERRLGR